MKKLTITLLLVVAGLAVSWFLFSYSRSAALHRQYDRLKVPAISQLPAQKMIVVYVQGDPSQEGGKALRDLYKTYFALRRTTRGLKMAAPRARWPKPWDTPKEQWLGIFGLPIPDKIMSLPKSAPENVKIEVWEYGTVAEILHKGPYGEEKPTIGKLQEYIAAQGYVISGPHEEEYLKGPGMFGPGNPQKYLTIIRYQVTKKTEIGKP